MLPERLGRNNQIGKKVRVLTGGRQDPMVAQDRKLAPHVPFGKLQHSGRLAPRGQALSHQAFVHRVLTVQAVQGA